MKVGIINYGMGNLLSVYSAVDYVGYDVFYCNERNDIKEADKIILPGVGAFKDCVRNLNQYGFWDVLSEEVLVKEKYILGICLGMQVMAKKGFEGSETDGLGWFDAEVVKIETNDKELKVPQIGWNDLKYDLNNKLFEGIPKDSEFYFVHSYYMRCSDIKDVIASCYYGQEITAAVNKDNIYATQFHPEKSQDYGLQVLKNFLDL